MPSQAGTGFSPITAGILTLAALLAAVCCTSSVAEHPPGQVLAAEATGGWPPQQTVRRSSLDGSACIWAVNLLLARDMTRVAGGRPDIGSDAEQRARRTVGAITLMSAMRAEQAVLATATADLLSRYRLDVSAELRDYQGPITQACTG